MKKLHNAILKMITFVMAIIFMAGMSSWDSDNLIYPILLTSLPLLWLIPFAIANDR